MSPPRELEPRSVEWRCKRCRQWQPMTPGRAGALVAACCDLVCLVQPDGRIESYDLGAEPDRKPVEDCA